MTTTNFVVHFQDASGRARAVAHTHYFADAVLLAETLAYNCHIMDFETGEILRTYTEGEITYMV